MSVSLVYKSRHVGPGSVLCCSSYSSPFPEQMEPTGVNTTAVPQAATSENFPEAISSNATGLLSVVMPDRSASFMSESFVMDGRMASDCGVTYFPVSPQMPTKFEVLNSSTYVLDPASK